MFQFLKRLDPNFFIELNLYKKIILLLLISSGVTLFFSILMGSFGVGISLFLDPGNYSDAFESYPVVGIFEAIIGVIFSGALISTITLSFIEWAENSRLGQLHKIIKEAFETHSLIKIRKLLKELNIRSKARYISITEAEIRLEISREDIIKTIQTYGHSRLRLIKNTKEVVIEEFNTNRIYGYCKPSDNKVAIISTQSYSDAGIGHFSSTLANSINANYVSNEFFSSGAPLKRRQINFSSNESFLALDTNSGFEALDEFNKDICEISNKSELIIYIGTSSGERENDIHILCGGKLGDGLLNIEKPTMSNLEKLNIAFEELKKEVGQNRITVCAHQEFGNTDDKHLSRAMHSKFKKDVLTVYISTRILWSEDEELYYRTIKSLMDFIAKI